MAKYKLKTADGRRTVTTDSPRAAIRMRYGLGATEAKRSTKVDAAVESAKTETAKKK